MVIERIGGGKPQEVRQAEKAESGKAPKGAAAKDASSKTPSPESAATTSVSERSRAAIKAYRIASESKPDIARAARVGELKTKVLKGEYKPSSADVADSIIKGAIKGL